MDLTSEQTSKLRQIADEIKSIERRSALQTGSAFLEAWRVITGTDKPVNGGDRKSSNANQLREPATDFQKWVEENTEYSGRRAYELMDFALNPAKYEAYKAADRERTSRSLNHLDTDGLKKRMEREPEVRQVVEEAVGIPEMLGEIANVVGKDFMTRSGIEMAIGRELPPPPAHLPLVRRGRLPFAVRTSWQSRPVSTGRSLNSLRQNPVATSMTYSMRPLTELIAKTRHSRKDEHMTISIDSPRPAPLDLTGPEIKKRTRNMTPAQKSAFISCRTTWDSGHFTEGKKIEIASLTPGEGPHVVNPATWTCSGCKAGKAGTTCWAVHSAKLFFHFGPPTRESWQDRAERLTGLPIDPFPDDIRSLQEYREFRQVHR